MRLLVEAGEPGVGAGAGHVLGGPGLAADRLPADLRRGGGAGLDDVDHHLLHRGRRLLTHGPADRRRARLGDDVEVRVAHLGDGVRLHDLAAVGEGGGHRGHLQRGGRHVVLADGAHGQLGVVQVRREDARRRVHVAAEGRVEAELLGLRADLVLAEGHAQVREGRVAGDLQGVVDRRRVAAAVRGVRQCRRRVVQRQRGRRLDGAVGAHAVLEGGRGDDELEGRAGRVDLLGGAVLQRAALVGVQPVPRGLRALQVGARQLVRVVAGRRGPGQDRSGRVVHRDDGAGAPAERVRSGLLGVRVERRLDGGSLRRGAAQLAEDASEQLRVTGARQLVVVGLLQPGAPVDVRVVLSWDTDSCDMDLWVTDPKDEKCYYQNTLTYLGGKISRDVTQGYGPEEFMLKKAEKGKYKVQVDYFGTRSQKQLMPVNLRITFYTHYGTPQQKQQETTVRLSNAKEVIEVGSFEF